MASTDNGNKYLLFASRTAAQFNNCNMTCLFEMMGSMIFEYKDANLDFSYYK